MEKEALTLYKYYLCKSFLDKLFEAGKLSELQVHRITKKMQKKLTERI